MWNLQIVAKTETAPEFLGIHFVTVTDGKQTVPLIVPAAVWQAATVGDCLDVSENGKEFYLHSPSKHAHR